MSWVEVTDDEYDAARLVGKRRRLISEYGPNDTSGQVERYDGWAALESQAFEVWEED